MQANLQSWGGGKLLSFYIAFQLGHRCNELAGHSHQVSGVSSFCVFFSLIFGKQSFTQQNESVNAKACPLLFLSRYDLLHQQMVCMLCLLMSLKNPVFLFAHIFFHFQELECTSGVQKKTGKNNPTNKKEDLRHKLIVLQLSLLESAVCPALMITSGILKESLNYYEKRHSQFFVLY